MAIVPAAASLAQNRPAEVTKPIMNIGTVAALVAVRLTAKKNSFQAKIAPMNTVAVSPGATMGRMIWVISVHTSAPSTRAAWTTSGGISSKNERSIQIAIGRFMAVYMISNATMLSRSPRLLMMM